MLAAWRFLVQNFINQLEKKQMETKIQTCSTCNYFGKNNLPCKKCSSKGNNRTEHSDNLAKMKTKGKFRFSLSKIKIKYMEHSLLDRRGKLHFYKGDDPHPISFHNEIAQTILPKANKPLDVLMNQGWVIIGSHFKAPYSAKEPTQSQINTLFELNIKYVSDFYSNVSWKVF